MLQGIKMNEIKEKKREQTKVSEGLRIAMSRSFQSLLVDGENDFWYRVRRYRGVVSF